MDKSSIRINTESSFLNISKRIPYEEKRKYFSGKQTVTKVSVVSGLFLPIISSSKTHNL